jgi:hypothetical protein
LKEFTRGKEEKKINVQHRGDNGREERKKEKKLGRNPT